MRGRERLDEIEAVTLAEDLDAMEIYVVTEDDAAAERVRLVPTGGELFLSAVLDVTENEITTCADCQALILADPQHAKGQPLRVVHVILHSLIGTHAME